MNTPRATDAAGDAAGDSGTARFPTTSGPPSISGSKDSSPDHPPPAPRVNRKPDDTRLGPPMSGPVLALTMIDTTTG